MKKQVLALLALALITDPSMTALAQDDRRDHDWNDEYWHHHHYGYWHGERGYWQYRDHTHEFIRVVPESGELRTSAADKGITFNTQYIAEIWGNPAGGVSNGTVYTGLMTFQEDIDLQKLLEWPHGSVFNPMFNTLYIHPAPTSRTLSCWELARLFLSKRPATAVLLT